MDEPYLIRRHGAFFRPDAAGYTTEIAAAGLYSREEAEKYLDAEGVTIHPLGEYAAHIERLAPFAERLLELRAMMRARAAESQHG